MKLTIKQALEKAADFERNGDYSSAILYCEAILKGEPLNLEANFLLGKQYLLLKNFLLALKPLELTTEINPNEAKYWQCYLNALNELNRQARYESVLEKAIVAGHKSHELKQNLREKKAVSKIARSNRDTQKGVKHTGNGR